MLHVFALLLFGTLANLIVSEDYSTLKGRDDGKFCRSDNHCKSGNCRGNRCGGRSNDSWCKTDDWCSSKNCYRHKCTIQDAYKLNGDDCSKKRECISHICENGKCIGRNKGDWCKENNWCSSGQCLKSKCTEQWPTQLFNGATVGLPWPANTKDAEDQGWKKSVNEACVSDLGEAWLYEGKRSSMHSVTLYFSPQIGHKDGIPGVLTGIQVDYYETIMDGLVGRFFSEKKKDEDGNHYHSVAVGFRDSSKYNLCDNSKPLPAIHEEYVLIAPGMENLRVPSHETSSDLTENWHEGSCIPGMGVHWFKSAETGYKNLTYKRNSVVPVVPMYIPGGSISGLFFWAPQKMQVWDNEICTPALFQRLPNLGECFTKCNFWDYGPGLNQKNDGPLFMCANTCDDKCYFEDSNDGIINTMHFFFYPINTLQCPETCRNGFNPFTDYSVY